MQVERFKTRAEDLGNHTWRIYVVRQESTYSMPVKSFGKPTHKQITTLFRAHHRNFDIEAEIIEIKKI